MITKKCATYSVYVVHFIYELVHRFRSQLE